MENKVYKRVSRHPSEDTKKKISDSLKGRNKSVEHAANISNGMKKYWGNPQNFPADDERHEGTGNGWIETGDIV